MVFVIEHAPNDAEHADDEVVLAVVVDGEYQELDWVKSFVIDEGYLYLSAEERMPTGQMKDMTTVVKSWDQVAWVPVGSMV